MDGPLKGVKVLDLTRVLAGPHATQILADLGAEVIKVERPGSGDDTRGWGPPYVKDAQGRDTSESTYFAGCNRGKLSVTLDLADPADQKRVRELAGTCDVLVENYKVGDLARYGLDYASMKALYPDLIYCSITGFGQAGPRAQEAGHDLNYAAVSGLLSLSPGTAASPTVPPMLAADIGGGSLPAVLNILLALRRRDATGEGMHLDIAMSDAMFTFAWYGLAQGHATGRFPGAGENFLAGGSPRYGLYATRDGRFLAVGALEEKFWETFCSALDLPDDLRDDGRDPAATRAAIAERIAARDADEWHRRLAPLDCCCTVVASLDEAVRDPHFAAGGLMAATAQTPDGRVIPLAAVPIDPQLRRARNEPRPVPALKPLSQ